MGVFIGDVVQDALGILGEVTGVGTQLYSEPRMIKDAGRAFNMLFKKHWWRQFTTWTTVTLDGTTGRITTAPFTNVIDFDDFAAVHRAGVSKGMPTLPEDMNPNIITGTTAQFWTSMNAVDVNFTGKKLQIYPTAATGDLNVRARFHPLDQTQAWEDTTSVEMDFDLLVYGTAYMALSGDDLNPQAKQDVQLMMDGRYKDIQNSLASQKIAYSERTTLPNNWFTNPY